MKFSPKIIFIFRFRNLKKKHFIGLSFVICGLIFLIYAVDIWIFYNIILYKRKNFRLEEKRYDEKYR